MFYQSTLLDNGIQVISERMDAVHSVSLGIWFRVGSRDEQPQQLGLSHFMEHMMFKGTPSRDALSISMEFDAMGAELNAFTSKEYTCYYARFVDEHLDKATEVLSDMVLQSVFDQSDIDSEREVVIEEIARSEDTPDDHIYDLFTQAMFPTHQLGSPILGTRPIVGGFTHQDCVAYHQRHYAAANCVIVACGNVDHDQLVSTCAGYLDSMPAGQHNPRDLVIEPARLNFSFMEKDTEQAHVLFGMPGIALGEDDRFAATLLEIALGGGMSSRLFQEIREKRGLAYAVHASSSPYLNAAQFAVYAGTRPANLSEVIEIINRELRIAMEKGLSDEELNRVREYTIGLTVLGMESTRSRMTRLGKNAVSDLPLYSLDEILDRYRTVTLADTQRVADRVLSQKPTLAIISPMKTAALEQEFSYLLLYLWRHFLRRRVMVLSRRYKQSEGSRMIKVLINGYLGRMGTQVVKAVTESADMQVVAGFDLNSTTDSVTLNGEDIAPAFSDLKQALESTKPDVMVDFTVPTAVEANLRIALPTGVDCVLGTTGLGREALEGLAGLAPNGTCLFHAPNFTTGAVLMMHFAKIAARFFPDAEVIEFHHNGKVDAPSGTAINTALSIAEERAKANLSSLSPGKETELVGREGARGTAVQGIPVHSIRSDGYVAHQEVLFGSPGQTLTIRHDSIDRSSYMPGVLLAIRSVGNYQGLVVGLENFMRI